MTCFLTQMDQTLSSLQIPNNFQHFPSQDQPVASGPSDGRPQLQQQLMQQHLMNQQAAILALREEQQQQTAAILAVHQATRQFTAMADLASTLGLKSLPGRHPGMTAQHQFTNQPVLNLMMMGGMGPLGHLGATNLSQVSLLCLSFAIDPKT